MNRSATWIAFIRYHTSFRTKLLLSYIFLILIPITALTGFCLGTMRAFSLSQAEKSFGESFQQASESLSYKVEQCRTTAQYIAQNEAIINALQNTETTSWQRYINYRDLIDPVIKSALSINTSIDMITIYQDNPVLVGHSFTIRPLNELTHNPRYQEILEYNEIWQIEDEQLSMNMRILSMNSQAPTMVLQMRINASEIFDISFETLEEYALSVTNSNGEILQYKSIISEEPDLLFSILTKAENAPFSSGQYHSWQFNITGTDWTLNMLLPKDTLEINTQQFSRTILIVTLLSVLLMLPLAFLFAHSLVTRINRLNRHMVKVEEGDLSATIPIVHHDEIGHLMKHFNDMLGSLNNTLEELTYTEQRQKEAEMSALRAQINPHFLYNTLSLISWKAIDQGASEVANITGTFSKFCRTVLNRGKSESLLSEEILNVQCYVSIQQEMHNGSFDVFYDIPEHLTGYVVPNFVLQPLVENAIVHGLDAVRGLKGQLLISVTEEDENLVARICNNGAEFKQDALTNVLSSRDKGYGLRNVQERVVYLYGKDYGLFLEPPTEDYSTCVVLKLRKKYTNGSSGCI